MVDFDRAMIELVREIRRRVTSDVKPDIKLANPYLLSCLQVIHGQTQDVILKTLIRGLFERAGAGWLEQLAQPALADTPQLVARVYRGQVSHSEAPAKSVGKSAGVQRIYRGQPVLVG